MASPSADRHTILTVPGLTSEIAAWDKYPVPPILYKYLRPERFDVLTKCLVRFSQRKVFEDVFELRPPVKSFGSDDEIAKYMELQKVPVEHRADVIKDIRALGDKFTEFTTSKLKVPDEFGVLWRVAHFFGQCNPSA
jgi:hypothetical protein